MDMYCPSTALIGAFSGMLEEAWPNLNAFLVRDSFKGCEQRRDSNPSTNIGRKLTPCPQPTLLAQNIAAVAPVAKALQHDLSSRQRFEAPSDFTADLNAPLTLPTLARDLGRSSR